MLTSNTSQGGSSWGLCWEGQQQCGRRLSPPGDCTRPSVERPQGEQQGGVLAQDESRAGLAKRGGGCCQRQGWCSKAKKKDCLTSTNLTMIVMERAKLMSSPVLKIFTFANEFLNCCIKYRNEPFGGWQELSGLVESQEGGVPYVSNAGKERPVCFFFLEHWTLAFDSHRVDISCKLTPLYLALW